MEKVTTRCLHFSMSLFPYKQKLSMQLGTKTTSSGMVHCILVRGSTSVKHMRL